MRRIFAIWAAKLSAIAGIILGKKASSGPGAIALKICPDLIKQLKKDIKYDVIVTCGTNGKTTTNNLLYAALTKSGYKVVCNKVGANMLTGVATAFAMECSWLGRLKADYACLEVDEAYTIKVFNHINPDVVVVTNLFRDQLDRYGEIETTMDIMKKAFENADYPCLVLNGDDPVSSGFGRNYKGKTFYYGIGEKVLPQTDDTKEGRFCMSCGTEQTYNYYHYSQLGDWLCPGCGVKRPSIDFEAKNVDIADGLKFSVDGKQFQLNYRGFYNIYNVLAVYSAINCIDIKIKSFNALLEDYKPQIGRMEEINLGKPFILNLAKNPAGFNQAISTVIQDSRRKDVIIAVNDKPSDGMDVSWLWDVNFEELEKSNLNTLSTSGMRRYDLALRFKYTDVKVDKITDNIKDAILACRKTDAEVCYVLVNYTMLFSTENILLDLQKEQGRDDA
ncbi:MAG: DUF1727 domain-containing protein [Clostridia bacterium]|nr:DUF1727 domain-containing protein [Clostridia bacterium]